MPHGRRECGGRTRAAVGGFGDACPACEGTGAAHTRAVAVVGDSLSDGHGSRPTAATARRTRSPTASEAARTPRTAPSSTSPTTTADATHEAQRTVADGLFAARRLIVLRSWSAPPTLRPSEAAGRPPGSGRKPGPHHRRLRRGDRFGPGGTRPLGTGCSLGGCRTPRPGGARGAVPRRPSGRARGGVLARCRWRGSGAGRSLEGRQSVADRGGEEPAGETGMSCTRAGTRRARKVNSPEESHG